MFCSKVINLQSAHFNDISGEVMYEGRVNVFVAAIEFFEKDGFSIESICGDEDGGYDGSGEGAYSDIFEECKR